MEVHHHPDLHHRKKHWKEYFLEFLMLFLAVTLGFFAENYREHLSDRSREREFMKSMVSDLSADTVTLNREYYNWHLGDLNSDTLLAMLKAPSSESVSKIYQLVSGNFYRFNAYKYSNHTVEELKSSGNFRLIRNHLITDSIMSYDNNMKYFLALTRGVETAMFDFKDAESNVLDYRYFNRETYLKNFTLGLSDSFPSFLTTDKLLLGQYYNKLFSYSLLARFYVELLSELKLEATHLIALINKQYSLQ